MARENYQNLVDAGADIATAALASAKNRDGTAYTLPVSGPITTTPTGAANLATGTATAGAASSTAVAARATRRSVTIRNEETAGSGNDCRLGIGGTNNFLLKAGEIISIDTVAAI